MKKMSLLFLSIISLLSFITIVKAESFYEGEYLNGEYIKKKNNGVTYYMTMQFIRDSKGNIVYCLEPFIKFEEGKAYTEFTGDLTSYNSLSEYQKRRISLIIYYGYGYGNRTDTKWYAITQFMIWKEMVPEGDVYFTGSLNGRKVTRYVDEMNEIYNDINNHETVPSYIANYEVNLGDNINITSLGNDYKIVYSDFDYSLDNYLIIKNVNKNGTVSFTKNSNYYKDKVVIFDSVDSQDLIRPGNVENPAYNIDIKVLKGNIMLDIQKDDSVYTVESNFADTCYEIVNTNGKRVDYLCTADQEMKYNSVDLVYGTYMVRQVSHGLGYLGDSNTYIVTLNKDKQQEQLTLYNYLLKNNIEITKYACKDNKCAYEENAEFEIIDKNNKSVDLIKTDKLGQAGVTLGYGTYQVKQITGLKDYSFVDTYQERIVDEETKHQRNLFNNYNKIEEVVVKREVPAEEIPAEEVTQIIEEEPKSEEIIEIPYTKTDANLWWLLLIFPLVIKRKFCN